MNGSASKHAPPARRVAITGLGVVTPVGDRVESFWNALQQGSSGVRRIQAFDPDAYNLPCKVAGEVVGFDPAGYMDAKLARRTVRSVQFALASARMALADAGLEPGRPLPDAFRRAAVILGSGYAGREGMEEDYRKFFRDPATGVRAINPTGIVRYMPNAATSLVAIEHGMHGPNYVISTACSSGANAIGHAYEMIRSGAIEAALCGGFDAYLSPGQFASWCAMRVLTKYNDEPARACRPFDRTRDGLVLGEGAAVLVLERLDRALERGARAHAEIAGFASNCDAHHITAPDAAGQAEAMRAALLSAGLEPGAIDYINAHGTGTELNDVVETESIKQVFGPHAYNVPISATKSMLGHTIGAASAIETVVCALALRDGVIPPTINLSEPDPACDLDYVPRKARQAPLAAAMSNSFAFGGSNAVLILRRYA